MEIDTRILNKMMYVLTNDSTWMSFKDHIGAHAEEEHDEGEEHKVGGDVEFADMFETPPITFSLEDVGTSSWQ
jgi:hypothetical protein